MAEHAQIDILKGDTIVRIHSGWGIPRNVLLALREVAATGRKTPQSIAKEFMLRLKDPSFGLDIIAKDFQQEALNFHYSVAVSVVPWKLVQEKCAGHKLIDNGDGTGSISPDITPARRRTLFIKAKAKGASTGA